MFLFPFEDVHTRNHEFFPINFRSSPVTIDDTTHVAATLVQEVPADSGNFPWYMTDSIAVLEDSYSEVVVNVIDHALNWQLFSDVGRPRSFVNVMSTNSALDPCLYQFCVECICNCSYVNMNFGSVRSDRVKLFFFFWGGGGGGGGLYSRLIAYSNISPPPTLGWM